MGSVMGMLERQVRPLGAARGQRSEVRSLTERIPQMQLTKTERVHGIIATALYMAVLFIVWAVV